MINVLEHKNESNSTKYTLLRLDIFSKIALTLSFKPPPLRGGGGNYDLWKWIWFVFVVYFCTTQHINVFSKKNFSYGRGHDVAPTEIACFGGQP